jgi:hypothetical protein
MKITNEEIADSQNLWDKYYNTSAFPENEFSLFTYDERLEMLTRDYPEWGEDYPEEETPEWEK